MANDNNVIISPVVGAVMRYLRDNEYDIDLYSTDGSTHHYWFIIM